MADEWSEEALARAQDRADRVSEAIDGASEARLRAVAQAARGSSKKLVWLQRAADVVVRAVEATGACACKVGCSHCCYISVSVSQAEADAIADFTGRKRQARPEGAQTLLEHLKESEEKGVSERRRRVDDDMAGRPCPFLGDDERCSVYEVRPLACRLHYSVSDDEGPCRLSGSDGGRTGAEVLYLNTLARRAHDAKVLGGHQVVADIREWFPEARARQDLL